MERLLLRLVINALALYVAIGTGLIQGIQAQNTQWWAYLLLGLIFALVNALVRPLLKLLTCPLILLTLGLFSLVINAALFWLTGWIGGYFGFGYSVAGFLPAFLGGLVVGVVNAVMTMLLRDELKREPKR
ncbi:MAG TPA: phage holin family protein [Anaerolineales bacterium]|nr:phage holin family protein [Anaerolineales bacterium]